MSEEKQARPGPDELITLDEFLPHTEDNPTVTLDLLITLSAWCLVIGSEMEWYGLDGPKAQHWKELEVKKWRLIEFLRRRIEGNEETR